MAESGGSYTGRRRRRTTSPRVRFANGAAFALITVGGIGTIIAVLGVCLFLGWVVLPLFLPASAEPVAGYSPEAVAVTPLQVGLDEYQVMGWSLLPDGELVAFRLDNGRVRQRLRPFGQRQPLSWSFPVATDQAAFGFADGTVQLLSIGFRTTFLEDTALTDVQRRELAARGAQARIDLGDGVAGVTPEGQLRLQEIQVDIGEPLPMAAGPVDGISLAVTASGPVLAALTRTAGGPALVAMRGSMEEDFLTGEARLSFAPPRPLPLPTGQATAPDFLAVNGMGQDVFLGWQAGTLARIHLGRSQDPFVAEVGRATPDGAEMTAMGFILGSATLLWGDSQGTLRGGFLVPLADLAGAGLAGAVRNTGRARKGLAVTKQLDGSGAPVTAMASSRRSRMVASGHADGSLQLFHVSNQRRILTLPGQQDGGIDLLAIGPKEDALVAMAGGTLRHWQLDPRYPEAGFGAMFRPVWYEGYEAPRHVWQSSSGTDDFEAKLGLMPLIFGTLKATLYSMLFAAPLALLAAIFTSEFLDRRTRSLVKPGIEMMASLPSVVLGFLAALVFAPMVEQVLSAVLVSLFTVPLMFLAGAYLWQLLPVSRAVRMSRWRFLCQVVMVAPGLAVAAWCGPALESLLFAGDLRAWLAWVPGDPTQDRYASPVGGWAMLTAPLCGVGTAILMNRLATPRLRRSGWSRPRMARLDLLKFLAGGLAAAALTLAVAWLLATLGFDPRGSVVDTYVQRNALVVGFVMGFAIIPIIYTIAEDALSTVPEHLRSASLGAGATPWQTAIRIVIPTAMSGLFSALMVGLGRAVGETMVVLMAAGNTPVMSWNVFEGFRTLSANIAVELPEAVRNSTHYRTLFLAALVLFAMTFVVNTLAEVVRLRFRKKAYQL